MNSLFVVDLDAVVDDVIGGADIVVAGMARDDDDLTKSIDISYGDGRRR